MGCFWCCSEPEPVVDKKALVVDIHQILCDKAWDMYKASLTPWGRLGLKRSDFKFEVPDNYFVFEQIGHTEFTPRNGHIDIKKPGEAKPELVEGSASNNNAQVMTVNRDITNPESVKIHQIFSNTTQSQLKYNFRFEKQRTSEVSISFQKGFTMGMTTNFKVGLPLTESEFGAEASMEYSVTENKEQKFSESMTMEATSEITVGSNSKLVAEIQLDEKKVFADFTTTMRMSIPQGRAPVYIKRKSNDTLASVFYCKNLDNDILWEKDGKTKKVSCAESVENAKGKELDFVISGVIKGSLVAKHEIHLKPMEGDSS